MLSKRSEKIMNTFNVLLIVFAAFYFFVYHGYRYFLNH